MSFAACRSRMSDVPFVGWLSLAAGREPFMIVGAMAGG
jgi:hypothetical protein